MANVTSEILLLDGPRNVVVLASGVLDTSNVTGRTIIDISTLLELPTALRLDKVTYSLSDQLAAQLYWDATADVLALTMAKAGHFKFKPSAGLHQPAPFAAGSTGDILLSTTGWASGIQTYSILIEAVKCGV